MEWARKWLVSEEEAKSLLGLGFRGVGLGFRVNPRVRVGVRLRVRVKG